MDWNGVIDSWNEDLFLQCHSTKMEDMEFFNAVLAKMNADVKANQEKADTNMKAAQDVLVKIDTNRESDFEVLKEMQAKMKVTMESQMGFVVTRMEADRRTDREDEGWLQYNPYVQSWMRTSELKI
jgi:hypothetical protein